MIFYFSATGNSKALAQELGRLLNDRVEDMVPLLYSSPREGQWLGDDKPLGFVFPIYGWSLPNIVRDFLCQLHLNDYNSRYTYFAVTCGDDVGVADRPIRVALVETGLQLNAGFSVNMPDSYVCLPGFDVDKDEEREAKFARFGLRVKEIADKIVRREEVMDIKRGAFAWAKTNILGWYFRKFLITDKPFRTTADCIACGTCVKVCPMHNITLDEHQDGVNGQRSIVNITWHGHCTGCLACYHHCPTRAVRFGKRTEKKGQYLYSKYPVKQEYPLP